MTQIGIVGDIDKIEDEAAKFYAFIGYVVSTSAGIEHLLFDCYYAASEQSKEEAAKEYYNTKPSEEQRQLANKAVQSLYADASYWDKTFIEIDNLSGANGLRNVVSHSILSYQFLDQGDDFYIELAIGQNFNAANAMRKKRSTKRESLDSLRIYACDLHKAYLCLYDFYNRQLKTRYKEED